MIFHMNMQMIQEMFLLVKKKQFLKKGDSLGAIALFLIINIIRKINTILRYY